MPPKLELLPSFLATLESNFRKQIQHPGRPAVLCMERDAFERDIAEMRRRSLYYNWISFPAYFWYQAQRTLFLPKGLVGQGAAGVFTGPDYEPYWTLAEDFAAQVLEHLTRTLNLAAIMSANIDYAIDEGLRRACAKGPVPFLVLCREVAIYKMHFDPTTSRFWNYRGRPVVDGVAVGSESTKDEFVGCNVIEENKIYVTGFPRLDPWVDYLSQPDEQPARDAVVLLSYQDVTYLSEENFRETLFAFAEASERHRERPVRFIVKCKHHGDAEALSEDLKRYPNHRLSVTYDTLSDVLQHARAVIGYNSTGLVESFLSDAQVFVPQWGGARRSELEQTYWRDNAFHRSQMTFLESRDELVKAIDRAVVAGNMPRPDRASRLKLISEHLHFDTERYATQRVESFVMRQVAKKSNPALRLLP